MGLIDFMKDAGEKLFGHGNAQATMTAAKSDPSNDAKIAAANSAAGDAIVTYIKSQNLSATGLTVTFDAASSTVSVFGVAPDHIAGGILQIHDRHIGLTAKLDELRRLAGAIGVDRSIIADEPEVVAFDVRVAAPLLPISSESTPQKERQRYKRDETSKPGNKGENYYHASYGAHTRLLTPDI